MSRIADALEKANQAAAASVPPVPAAEPVHVAVPLTTPEPPAPLPTTPNATTTVEVTTPAMDVSTPTVDVPAPTVDVPTPTADHAPDDVDSRAATQTAGAGTLAEVLAPGFTRSWIEAVAIVQAVAAKLPPGAAVPGPDYLLLEDAGTVTFASTNESLENPVTSLAVLLGWLIEGTRPPRGLQRLAADNACATPPVSSVRDWCHALDAFESADRHETLVGVASRMRRPRHEGRVGLFRQVGRRVSAALRR